MSGSGVWIGGVGIDTAYDYFDQADIRAVLAAKKVKRSDIFITTKVRMRAMRVLRCTPLLRCVSCHTCIVYCGISAA